MTTKQDDRMVNSSEQHCSPFGIHPSPLLPDQHQLRALQTSWDVVDVVITRAVMGRSDLGFVKRPAGVWPSTGLVITFYCYRYSVLIIHFDGNKA